MYSMCTDSQKVLTLTLVPIRQWKSKIIYNITYTLITNKPCFLLACLHRGVHVRKKIYFVTFRWLRGIMVKSEKEKIKCIDYQSIRLLFMGKHDTHLLPQSEHTQEKLHLFSSQLGLINMCSIMGISPPQLCAW